MAVTVLALIGLDAKDAWMDEACSVAATVQLREILVRTSGTMASYYLLLNGWIRIDDSLWWLRFLSVLFGVGAVVVTGVFATRLRGSAVGRWAALFLGVSWMLVRYSQEARSFTMVLVVVGLSWLALDHLVQGSSRRGWLILHVAMGALAPLTHGLAVLAVLAQAVALVLARVHWRVWTRVLPGLVAGLAVVGYLYQMGASEVGAGAELTVDTAERVVLRVVGGPRWDGTGWFDVRYVLVAAVLHGAVLAWRRYARSSTAGERFRAVAPVVWAVGPIGGLLIISAVRPQLQERYAIAAIPALALLQADSALNLHAALRRVLSVPPHRLRWAPVVPLALAAVLLAAQVPTRQGPSDRTWTSMVEVLARDGRSGDAILVPRGAGRLMLDYAWSQADPSELPELESLSPTHPMGRVQRFGSRLPLDDALARLDGVDRVWVVQVRLSGEDTSYRDARFHPSLAWVFEPVETHQFRQGTLVLMTRKPR